MQYINTMLLGMGSSHNGLVPSSCGYVSEPTSHHFPLNSRTNTLYNVKRQTGDYQSTFTTS